MLHHLSHQLIYRLNYINITLLYSISLSAKCLVRDDVHRQTFDSNRFKSVQLLHFLIVPLTIMSLFTFLIIEQKKLLSSPIASRQRAYELRLIFFLFLFDLKLRNKKKIIQTRRPIPFINESSKSKQDDAGKDFQPNINWSYISRHIYVGHRHQRSRYRNLRLLCI